MAGGGRGNLRIAKTPPLQAALRGERCDAYGIDHHLRPGGHQRERREITTRHWLGRALALLGTSPTKIFIDNRLPLSPPCAYRARRTATSSGKRENRV